MIGTTEEQQEVLVRGSAEHKEYLRYQFGRIKDTVAGFETRIAVAGRTMLLLYVVYITVKAGMGSALYQNLPPWGPGALLALDVVMLALQVLGLEGSVPGLIHLSEELEEKGKTKEARTVRNSSSIAQMLVVATAIDIVLQHSHFWGTWDITDFAIAYSNCLFVLRVLIIGLYLIAMARLEHKGPKVISAHEAAKKQEQAEQKQIRMDNVAVQATIDQALTNWNAEQSHKLVETIAEIKASLVLPEIAPAQVDVQAIIQAVADHLIPQIQAKFQAVDEEIFRQKVCLSEVETQAKILPELRQKINTIQAKSLPEKAASIQADSGKIQAKRLPEKQPAQATSSGREKVIRLVPANATREELIAEAVRLHEVEGMSSYKIAERLGKSAKTVQSWLSSGKDQADFQAEDNEIQAANG